MTSRLYQVRETGIPGCLELFPRIHQDTRGRFVKAFHAESFAALGLETRFCEEYYSTSSKGVVRGLHFQIPPEAHSKLVFCTQGIVQDVVVDLRVDSPTFQQHTEVELSAENANMLYIPSGLAHGFCVLTDTATMIYKVSTQYSPDHDMGIHWNSAGIRWDTDMPLTSERDSTLPKLHEFNSPFTLSSSDDEAEEQTL